MKRAMDVANRVCSAEGGASLAPPCIRVPRGWGWMAIALCLFAVSAPSHAHGVWFAQRGGQMALVYGHGAEDLDMVRRFERVREVRAFDASGASVEAPLLKGPQLVTLDMSAKPAVLAAVLDNGYWSKRPDGSWVNRGRDEVPDARENGRFVKYAVRIEGVPTAALAPIPGQALQVVPVSARLPRHANEPMTVRVLLHGRPVAGARVVRDYVNDPDAKPLVTGKDGAVTFRLRNNGLNVIAAMFDAPPDDPVRAAKTGMLATLSFALEHGPE
jgi:nickel transport protein